MDPSVGPGAATRAWESPDGSYRVESFEWGEANAVSDFLFVIDPSISMSTVIDQVRAGFASLADGEAFPSKARVAVMTMVPWRPPSPAERRLLDEIGDTQALTMVPDRAVRIFPGAALLPGLGALVDAEAIARFQQQMGPDNAFAEVTGCDAWFEPGARDAQGVPCLVAHTQLVLQPLRAEAGLIALNRLVRSPHGEGLFRPGASVNVVFVSDTHDPGIPVPDDRPATQILASKTPSGAGMEAAILTTYAAAAVRLHAIAPHSECGEPWSPAGATYLRAAEQTGGLSADVCGTHDYEPFIRQMATTGAVAERGYLPLGKPAASVRTVEVDAQPADFVVRGEGRVIEVPALQAGARARVEIEYDVERKPAARPRRAEGRPAAAAAPAVSRPENRPAEAPTNPAARP